MFLGHGTWALARCPVAVSTSRGSCKTNRDASHGGGGGRIGWRHSSSRPLETKSHLGLGFHGNVQAQMAAGHLFQAFSTARIREIRKNRDFRSFQRFWTPGVVPNAPAPHFHQFCTPQCLQISIWDPFLTKLAICKICNLSSLSSFSDNLSDPTSARGLREYFIVRHFIPPISLKSPLKIISSSLLG